MLLPKDTNPGTIFGAGSPRTSTRLRSRGARQPHRYVTKSMHEVEFHAPVFVGDIISFFTNRPHRPHLDHGEGAGAERWGSGAQRVHGSRRPRWCWSR
jgi:hypothetical protein